MMRTVSQLVWRGSVLFLVGVVLIFVLNVLQAPKYSVPFQNVDSDMIYSRWWLWLLCGSGSTLLGLIYPRINNKTEQNINQEWSTVFRSLAMFYGINKAYTVIDCPSNLQLGVLLVLLSFSMWWYFDRTTLGLGMGLVVAALATLVTQVLVYNEICIYTENEFSYMRSWLPCIGFCGGITVANFGKQLAVNDYQEGENKSHAE